MDYLYSLLAGVIQGLTEFLPVSSSGHLVLIHDILKFDFFDNVLFDVAMHLATLVALVVYFRRDIVRLVRGFFASLSRRDLRNDPDQRLPWLILLAMVPAVAVGYLLESFIGAVLRRPAVVAAALALVAGLFFAAERFAAKTKTLAGMTAADAAAIGAAQAVAFIPGVSRSGITMAAGMGRKLTRTDAARFSFLLSIPTVFGAAVKKGLEIGAAGGADWAVLAVGFVAALASGILAIRFFMGFVGRHSLRPFAWYRLALSALVIVWLLAKG
ncbi:MAG: undecaprenyl-diphosphate phosphatase [Acidobacteriota bacterium]